MRTPRPVPIPDWHQRRAGDTADVACWRIECPECGLGLDSWLCPTCGKNLSGYLPQLRAVTLKLNHPRDKDDLPVGEYFHVETPFYIPYDIDWMPRFVLLLARTGQVGEAHEQLAAERKGKPGLTIPSLALCYAATQLCGQLRDEIDYINDRSSRAAVPWMAGSAALTEARQRRAEAERKAAEERRRREQQQSYRRRHPFFLFSG